MKHLEKCSDGNHVDHMARGMTVFTTMLLFLVTLWDKVFLLASLWAKASRAYPNYTTGEMQRNWVNFLNLSNDSL